MKKLCNIHKLLLSTLVMTGLLMTCGREGPEGPPDRDPPLVTATSPYYQEQDVPVNTSISITFSEPMNAASLHDQSFTVQEGNAAVSGAVSCSGSSAIFKPAENLKPNSSYNVIIGVGVKDAAGNSMAAPYVYSFRTGTRIAAGTHTITVAPAPNGTVSPQGPVTVNDGETRTFTCTPGPGYHIGSVTGCGGSLAGTIYTTGFVTADCTVTAAFAPDRAASHTVTARVADGTGSITPQSATVPDGGKTSFTVAPGSGWQIKSVSGCGGSLGGTTYTTGAVTASCEVVASFEVKPPPPVVKYTITAEADSHGQIIPAGKIEVAAGADQSFEIKADSFYYISSIEVDGAGIDISRFDQNYTYTFSHVDRNHTIKAKFKGFWKIEASVEGNIGGTINPSDVVYVEEGASQSFDLVPDPGYGISEVIVDALPVEPLDPYPFTNVTMNHTIKAVFAVVSNGTPTAAPADDGGGDAEYEHDDSIETGPVGSVSLGNTADLTRRTDFFPAIASAISCGAGSSGNDYTSGPVINRVAGCGGPLRRSVHTPGQGPPQGAVKQGEGGSSLLTVTPSQATNGEIIPAEPQQVSYNGVVAFTLRPANGYSIASVTGCGGSLSDNIYTTGPVTADCTIAVEFTQSFDI